MEYTIENNPTLNDIKQMIEIDKQVYDGDDCGNLEKCLEWKKICPELYTAIKYENKVVGYINFVPITKECYEKFKSGKIKDYNIDLKDFLPFKKGKNFCLFMSVAVDKDFRQKNAIFFLLKAFLEKIKNFEKQGILIESSIADCITFGGEKFVCERFNAKFICETDSGSKIYEFEIKL